MVDDEYNTKLIEDLLFTEAEVDMLFFHALIALGHPQVEQYVTTDAGHADLMSALVKIQDYFGVKETDGEPVVLRGL